MIDFYIFQINSIKQSTFYKCENALIVDIKEANLDPIVGTLWKIYFRNSVFIGESWWEHAILIPL